MVTIKGNIVGVVSFRNEFVVHHSKKEYELMVWHRGKGVGVKNGSIVELYTYLSGCQVLVKLKMCTNVPRTITIHPRGGNMHLGHHHPPSFPLLFVIRN